MGREGQEGVLTNRLTEVAPTEDWLPNLHLWLEQEPSWRLGGLLHS